MDTGIHDSPGNEHVSRTFHKLYQKIKSYAPEKLVADSGYKTAPIAQMLIEDSLTPVFPYTRPQKKTGFFRKYEYVYDEYYDFTFVRTKNCLTIQPGLEREKENTKATALSA